MLISYFVSGKVQNHVCLSHVSGKFLKKLVLHCIMQLNGWHAASSMMNYALLHTAIVISFVRTWISSPRSSGVYFVARSQLCI
jgi:hypothetical protein